jgi:hypothetical protein
MEMDCRNALIKIVEQNNKIVRFLATLEIQELEVLDNEILDIIPKLPNLDLSHDSKKIENVEQIIDEFIEAKESLQEFEDELKKYKDKIAPGQVGEA